MRQNLRYLFSCEFVLKCRICCRLLCQSPEAGLLVSSDTTLTRLHSQPVYQHRPTGAPLCWDTTSSVMSSPCQPTASCIKREVMQLPSNGVDENRSSVDSWSYVSPSNVTAVTYYARENRESWPSFTYITSTYTGWSKCSDI